MRIVSGLGSDQHSLLFKKCYGYAYSSIATFSFIGHHVIEHRLIDEPSGADFAQNDTHDFDLFGCSTRLFHSFSLSLGF